MGEIKAIETVYNGYRFRSRLESRWAVFFDAAGIKYQYEPEGFEVKNFYGGDGEPDVYRYLPDFYIPEFGCYAEVKANKDALLKDESKLNAMIDFHATPVADGLLILGQIPPSDDFWLPAFIKFSHHKGVVADLVIIEPAYKMRSAHLWTVKGCIDCTGGTDLPRCRVVSRDLYHRGNFINTYVGGKLFLLAEYEHLAIVSRTNKCLDAARQARFEHGETPKVKVVGA